MDESGLEKFENPLQSFIRRFNSEVLEQYATLSRFPHNCSTVSGLLEFADCKDLLDDLEMQVDEEEFARIKKQIEEIGQWSHDKLVEEYRSGELLS